MSGASNGWHDICARPPIAMQRLERLTSDRLIYRFKRPWRDGTTHIVLEPLDCWKNSRPLCPLPKPISYGIPTFLFLWLLPALTHPYVECASDPLSRRATLESAPHNSRPRPARSLKTSGKRDSTGCSPSRQRSDDGVSRRAPTHRPFPAQLSPLRM